MVPALAAYGKIIDSITNHPAEIPRIGDYIARIADEVSDKFESTLSERESKLHQVMGVGIRTSHLLTFDERTVMVGYDLMDDDPEFIYIVVAMVREIGDRMVRTRKAVFLYDESMKVIYQIEDTDPAL